MICKDAANPNQAKCSGVNNYNDMEYWTDLALQSYLKSINHPSKGLQPLTKIHTVPNIFRIKTVWHSWRIMGSLYVWGRVCVGSGRVAGQVLTLWARCSKVPRSGPSPNRRGIGFSSSLRRRDHFSLFLQLLLSFFFPSFSSPNVEHPTTLMLLCSSQTSAVDQGNADKRVLSSETGDVTTAVRKAGSRKSEGGILGLIYKDFQHEPNQ